MRNDDQIIQLRPDLGLDSQAAGNDEKFQNETLRPILKLQHEMIASIFQQYIVKRKDVFQGLSRSKRMTWIADNNRADQRFRNLLAGTVVGLFTAAELQYFLEHESECMRRLSALMVQRIQSMYEVAPGK